MADAVARDDMSLISGRLQSEEHTCTVEDTTPTIAQFPCDYSGQVVQVVAASSGGEGTPMKLEAARERIDSTPDRVLVLARDAFGSGELRVAAYALSNTGGEQRLGIIVTAIVNPGQNDEKPYRFARQFWFRIVDGFWSAYAISFEYVHQDGQELLLYPYWRTYTG